MNKESDRSNLIRNDVHADIHGMRCKNNAAAVEGGLVRQPRKVHRAAGTSQRKMHRQQRKMCRERQIRMEQKKA